MDELIEPSIRSFVGATSWGMAVGATLVMERREFFPWSLALLTKMRSTHPLKFGFKSTQIKKMFKYTLITKEYTIN
jgi:hypothetical protein